MRSINLLRIAVEPEWLRLRALIARQAKRAVFGTIAAVFAMAVLTLAEVVVWQALRLKFDTTPATAILLGVNLLMGVFGVLAARSAPSHTEQEAMRVRQQALQGARGTLAFRAVIPVASGLVRLRRQGNGSRRFRLPIVGR